MTTDIERRIDELIFGAHRERLLERFEAHRQLYPDVFGEDFRMRPVTITASRHRALQRAAESTARSILAVVERLLSSRELRTRVGIPDHLEPFIELDREHGAPTLLGRLDGHPAADGSFQFIEYNSAAAGIHEADRVADFFERSSLASEVRREHPFRSQDFFDEGFQALLRERSMRGEKRLPGVAVLRASPDVRLGAWGSGAWLCHAAARGVPLLLVDPSDFRYEAGRLTVGDRRIDLVAIMPEQLLRNAGTAGPLMQAIRDGAARVMHGLSRSMLARAKTLFAYMTDPVFADAFGDCVEPEARACLPWTRIVTEQKTEFDGRQVDLLTHLEGHRDDYVLKPNNGRLGQGVVIGRETDPTTWSAAIARAVTEQDVFVAQRFVELDREEVPTLRDGELRLEKRLTDLCPYLWNGAVAGGAVVRMDRIGSLEISSVGNLGALWILEE